MGNGHPIAALITRRDIVDPFLAFDEYFSTFGGNPVSAAAALTVLDIIEDETLIARSATVGDHLRSEIATWPTTSASTSAPVDLGSSPASRSCATDPPAPSSTSSKP